MDAALGAEVDHTETGQLRGRGPGQSLLNRLSGPVTKPQSQGSKALAERTRSEQWNEAELRVDRGLEWDGGELAGRRREVGLLHEGC